MNMMETLQMDRAAVYFFHVEASDHEIISLREFATVCVCVCACDSPRPGAADHFEERGRLTEKREK